MPGTAYVLFHHVMGECDGVRGVWGYVRGGMGASVPRSPRPPVRMAPRSGCRPRCAAFSSVMAACVGTRRWDGDPAAVVVSVAIRG